MLDGSKGHKPFLVMGREEEPFLKKPPEIVLKRQEFHLSYSSGSLPKEVISRDVHQWTEMV